MNLEQSLKQIGTLSPQMIQSMEILQMSTQELEGYLQLLSLENPVLELKMPAKSPEINAEEFGKRLQWLEEGDRQNAFYLRSDADDGEYDPLTRAYTDGGLEPDLYTHLTRQLDRKHRDDAACHAAKFIAGCLDEHGYLDETLETLCEETNLSLNEMRSGLELLRSLDPAGVGAFDLSQCLVLQLQRMGETGCAVDIAGRYLDALSRQRYKAIACDLGVSLSDVIEAAELIRTLEPRPGESFKRMAPPAYIIPDVFVEEVDGELKVTTNTDSLPRLKISSYYNQLLQNTEDKEVRSYLEEKTRQIRFAIKAVQQRDSTLLSCAQSIVSRQEGFFRGTDQFLCPMTHSDIAEDLGIHGSTVSRAIREKYIQCSRGVYPLSYFFTRSVGNVSSHGAHALLKELIASEDKSHPLSDQKISEKLAGAGCRISRRTVAKYRDILGIPDASRRKI